MSLQHTYMLYEVATLLHISLSLFKLQGLQKRLATVYPYRFFCYRTFYSLCLLSHIPYFTEMPINSPLLLKQAYIFHSTGDIKLEIQDSRLLIHAFHKSLVFFQKLPEFTNFLPIKTTSPPTPTMLQLNYIIGFPSYSGNLVTALQGHHPPQCSRWPHSHEPIICRSSNFGNFAFLEKSKTFHVSHQWQSLWILTLLSSPSVIRMSPFLTLHPNCVPGSNLQSPRPDSRVPFVSKIHTFLGISGLQCFPIKLIGLSIFGGSVSLTQGITAQELLLSASLTT